MEDQYVQFDSGKYDTMGKMLKWVQDHYGYGNILMSLLIAFFLKIMFRKQQYNFYEIIVLLCYLLGVGMLIFSVSIFIEGIIQQKISAFLGMAAMIYIVWGIGKFYNPLKISSYVKATFAYLLGAGSMYLIIVITAILIDKLFLN